jgi:hypothetical protein
MATILNAGTTTGTSLAITTDTTGAMKLQTSGVDAISISSSQVATFANTIVGSVNGNAATSNAIANTGGWAITPSSTKLIFSYNGTNVASMDSSGNFKSLLTVAAGTTP